MSNGAPDVSAVPDVSDAPDVSDVPDVMNSSTSTMNVQDYEEPLMKFTAYRWHKNLMLYVPPVLVLIGTIGNALSIVILTRRAMRKQSTYFYLAILSSADTIVLYAGLLRLWIGEITGEDIRDWNNWSCRIISFLGYTMSDFSGWLIIAVTFERYLAVCYPLKASVFTSREKAIKVVCGLLTVLVVINCHFFWTILVVNVKYDGDYTPKCHSIEPYTRLIDDIWPWVDAFIYSFLPFLFILVLNTLIIRHVIKARSQRGQMRSTGGRKSSATDRSSSDRDGGKITIMLMVISFTFLLTTLPMNLTLIATKFLLKTPRDNITLINLRLAMTITELLMYVNHSMNFFLYCATGHKFRSELFWLFVRRKSSQGQHLTELTGAMSHALQVHLLTPIDVVKAPEVIPLPVRDACESVDL